MQQGLAETGLVDFHKLHKKNFVCVCVCGGGGGGGRGEGRGEDGIHQ